MDAHALQLLQAPTNMPCHRCCAPQIQKYVRKKRDDSDVATDINYDVAPSSS